MPDIMPQPMREASAATAQPELLGARREALAANDEDAPRSA
jgi:hypothetical protein